MRLKEGLGRLMIKTAEKKVGIGRPGRSKLVDTVDSKSVGRAFFLFLLLNATFASLTRGNFSSQDGQKWAV